MYTEDELLPLSALQHLLFCERQCALIHIEQVWSENRLTVEGKQMHEHVDAGIGATRGTVRIEHGVFLRSRQLGLAGIADVVEFQRRKPLASGLENEEWRWSPFPVEYKRGKPKQDSSDRVQLCAQALCLEEMLGCAVPSGALFYGKTRRRIPVQFSLELRQETELTARRLHELVDCGVTPPAVLESKCRRCSLKDLCIPETVQRARPVDEYLEEAVFGSGEE